MDEAMLPPLELPVPLPGVDGIVTVSFVDDVSDGTKLLVGVLLKLLLVAVTETAGVVALLSNADVVTLFPFGVVQVVTGSVESLFHEVVDCVPLPVT